MDYTAITSAIDLSPVAVGIGAIAALLAVIYAALRGAEIILLMIDARQHQETYEEWLEYQNRD